MQEAHMARGKHWIAICVLIVAVVWMSGCGNVPEKPRDALLVSELLAEPVYDREVKLYGQVSSLHEMYCPCFELTVDGSKVEAWYDLLSKDGKTSKPPVSVEGISNGDWVVITGELQTPEGQSEQPSAFWISSIEKAR
jgi:hypothetical protein